MMTLKFNVKNIPLTFVEWGIGYFCAHENVKCEMALFFFVKHDLLSSHELCFAMINLPMKREQFVFNCCEL